MAQASTMETPMRVPLVSGLANRDRAGLKDARIVNGYVELDPKTNEYWVQKRPGLSTPVYTLSGAGRGMYLWSTNYFTTVGLIEVAGTTVYTNGTTVLGTIATGTPVYFQQMIGSPPFLVFGDGQNAYYIQSGAVTKITDSHFPTTFVPGWAYLDGTLYVMDPAGNIQGSNINDPTTWNPLNTIPAQVEPDGGVALTQVYSYVIAIKQRTTEVFYDAGNATGSPLGRVPGGFINYGCVDGATLQKTEGTLIWMSASAAHSPQIVRMDNLAIEVISTPAVERLIETAQYTDGHRSLVLRMGGHKFYVVTNVGLNLTLAYDFDQKLWYRWTDANGNYWPMGAHAYDSTHGHLVQDYTALNSVVYACAPAYIYPLDNASIVPVDIYTENFDAGVDRVKALNMMRFKADQTVGSELQVRVSDDDYQTWSNYRLADLSQVRPSLDKCGSFYKRAWNLRHQSPTDFRIKAVELQLDKGTL